MNARGAAPTVTARPVDQPAVDPAYTALAFDELYTAVRPPMVRLAYLLTGSSAQAEEATQDAFIRVLERWDRLDNHAAYVRVCVINHCNSWHRRRNTAKRLDHLTAVSEQHDDRYDELSDALARLPRRRRTIVVLRFYEGLSLAEIADVLDIATGTVKSSLHRALAQLKGALQ